MSADWERIYSQAEWILPAVSLPVVCVLGVLTDRRLLRRQVRPHISLPLIVAVCFLGIWIGALVDDWLEDGPFFNQRDSVAVGVLLLIAQYSCFVLCSFGIMQLLSKVVPKGLGAIHGGPGNFRFYLFGLLVSCLEFLYALCLFPFMGVRWAPKGDPLPFVVVAAVLTLGVLPFLGLEIRKAISRKLVHDVMESDTRPSILFVRSFKDEGLPFETLASRRRKFLPDVHGTRVRFELYIAETVQRELGPFIALGNPHDDVAPEGAARKYCDDSDWRRQFQELVGRCSAILILPGASGGLDWEMAWLLRSGNASKLFLVFGRYAYADWNDSLTRYLKSLVSIERLKSLVPLYEPLVWSDYRKRLTCFGYALPLNRPHSSTVIGFTPQGHGGQVSDDFCGSPEDYVEAIISHLARLDLLVRKRVIITPPPTQ